MEIALQPDMMGSFASSATASMVAKNGRILEFKVSKLLYQRAQ